MPESPVLDLLQSRLADLEALTTRTNKVSVMVVQQFPIPEDRGVLFPPVRESIANVMAFAEIGTAFDASWILDYCAATVDLVAADCDQKLRESAEIVRVVRAKISGRRLMLYSDNQAWFDSALDMVQRLEGGVTGRTVVLCGSGNLADLLAFTLPRLGARLLDPEDLESVGQADVVLGASQKRASIDEAIVERLPTHAAIYDLGIGNLVGTAAECARRRELRLYRLDNRAGISSAIVRLLETDHMVDRLMGHIRVRDVDIVAGGLLAPPGSIIVDDIRNPSFVFGVADGEGRFRRPPLSREDEARIDFVRSLTVKVDHG